MVGDQNISGQEAKRRDFVYSVLIGQDVIVTVRVEWCFNSERISNPDGGGDADDGWVKVQGCIEYD